MATAMSKEGRAYTGLKTIDQQLAALERAANGVAAVQSWYENQQDAIRSMTRAGYSAQRVNDELIDLGFARDKRLAAAQEEQARVHAQVTNAALGLAEDVKAEYERSLPRPEKVAARADDLRSRVALLPVQNTGEAPAVGEFARAEIDRALAHGDRAALAAIEQVLAPELNVPLTAGEGQDARERRECFRALQALSEQRVAPVKEAEGWVAALQGVQPRVDANSNGGVFSDGMQVSA